MDNRTAKKILNSVRRDYNTIAAHFSDTRSQQWPAVRALVQQYITPGKIVLDLGCGNGRLADVVTEIKANYIGIDVSPELIARAQQLRPDNVFRVGTMMQIPLPDNSVDHTLLIASLHHIPSLAYRIQTLQEIKRVTRPGGYIICMNWNLHQWRFWKLRLRWNARKLFRRHHMDWNDTLVPWKNPAGAILAERYYHGFTEQEIKKLAKKISLPLVQQYYETHGTHVPRYRGQNLVSILKK
ncbi:MAG: class I SAM-dependent methyltransferase [Candidatus Kerfeldbacteria bacterium]|nr:class I SAM-dependent methyltransferase [Candidatus Kerfeldbacteria bacterium]